MNPVKINVFGDKEKKLEPARHSINFPGGSIDVERTSDGEYWAHIALNTTDREEPALTHRTTKRGRVTDSRIDYNYGRGNIRSIVNDAHIQHIAIRIALDEVTP